MKNNQTKCYRFWLTNRNPITMKKCADEKKNHIHNQSKEDEVALEKWRDNHLRTNKFDYDEIEDCSDRYDDSGFMGENTEDYV